jgi:hypothetical protein
MSSRNGGDGWRPWRVIPVVAGGAMSVPVVVGFVALGAAVLVARSLRDVARETWSLLPTLRSHPRPSSGKTSDAA